MNQPQTEIRAIEKALSYVRAHAAAEEYDLHAAIAEALEKAQIPHVHEYKLGPHRRIDFICGRIGIEIKKGRPAPSALRQQLQRYLSSPELDAAVVVTQQAVRLPETIAGKPVLQISLNRLWGVALP